MKILVSTSVDLDLENLRTHWQSYNSDWEHDHHHLRDMSDNYTIFTIDNMLAWMVPDPVFRIVSQDVLYWIQELMICIGIVNWSSSHALWQ